MSPSKSEEPAEVEYSYDEAVELAGHGRYNQMVLVTCSVISNAVALDMFGFSLILATAVCDLQLSISLIGLLASMPFAGLLFAVPWGYYADTRGRRRALLLSCSVGFAMAALGSMAPNWQALLVTKLVGCSFSTAAFSLTMAYLGEFTGNGHRSEYLSIMNSINLSSEAVTFLLAIVILPLPFNIPIPWLGITYRPWRLLTLLMALPLGMGAIMMWFLHESPKFLANKGYNDEALEVLRKVYACNGGKREEYQVKALTKSPDAHTQEEKSLWESITRKIFPIFKPPLLWRTLQLSYLLVICCATNNAFVMWFPTIVNLFFTSYNYGLVDDLKFCERFIGNITNTQNETENMSCNDTISANTIYTGIAMGIFFTVLNLCVSQLAAWRRLVLLATFLIPATCAATTNVFGDPIVSMILFGLVQGTSIGIGVVASYIVDIFPTSFRGVVTSLAMMTARLGSLAGVNVVGPAFFSSCELTFYCCAGFVFSGVAVALLLPSDTKSTR